MIDDQERNSLKNYKRNLSLVLTSCLALFIYDVSERGKQLSDPFYSVWSEQGHPIFASFAIGLAMISAVIYIIFLCFKCWMVWTTILQKRQAQLYRLNEFRRLRVESIIYRFKFLMVLTFVCASATILSYTMQQYGEGHPNFGTDDLMELEFSGEEQLSRSTPWFLHTSSAFFTGTFGMWNIYVLLLLVMYAPSHKHYANAQVLENESDLMMHSMDSLLDTVHDTVVDSTMFTTFLKPATD